MIAIPGVPPIKGLVFRQFRNESDFSVMSTIGRRGFEADGIDFIETAEDIADDYRGSRDSDPHSGIIIAEIRGEPVGYSRIWADPGEDESLVFWHIVQVLPEWRGSGMRLAMFRFCERQIVRMAKLKNIEMPCRCKVWALNEPNEWRDLVLGEGYEATMHFFMMIRGNLDNIPEVPLPKGLELRPVRPEDYPKIWAASREAFRGKPWFVEALYDKKHYDSWVNSPTFTPEFWKVAWDGDQVAGMARNFIPTEENLTYGRKRGETQHLSVMPRWRRRGLGRALLSESLRMLREKGFEEAVLDVETQSTTGEIQLYLSMGYTVHRKYALFTKLLEEDQASGS